MKKVIVTGGNGFIGSNLIKFLIQKKYFVINIDKNVYSKFSYILKDLNKKNYIFYKLDINNRSKINNILRKHKPKVIFNLAAETHVDRSIDNPKNFIQSNIIGTFNLLQIFKEFSKKNKTKLIHISTDEVYGDVLHGRSSENYAYQPSSPYAASKAASDHLVSSYVRTYKIPAIITNCSNNYGPYQFPEKLVPHMILNGLSGKPMPIYGDGSQIRDWLYVEDHAHALLKVVSNGKLGETYMIGGGNERTNLEVVRLICDLLDEFIIEKPNGINSFRDLISFVADRPGHDGRYAIDATKIQRELGWSPKESLESGMRKTVLWYLKNKVWWERVLSGSYALDRIGIER